MISRFKLNPLQLKRRIWHIRQSPHYEMSHYKCWRDLADNMELYVDKLKKELSTKKAGKESDGWGSFEKTVGKDGRVRHKFTPERKERDAPTEAVSWPPTHIECDVSAPPPYRSKTAETRGTVMMMKMALSPSPSWLPR